MERALDLRDGQVDHAVALSLICRVRNEDVDPPELLARGRDDVDAGLLLRQVRRKQQALTARLAHEALGDLCVVLLLRQVHDRDVGALSGEGDRDGAADAGVAARDERLAALQAAATHPAVLTVVGRGAHVLREAGLAGLLLLGEAARRLARIGLARSIGHGNLL